MWTGKPLPASTELSKREDVKYRFELNNEISDHANYIL
jgi:hypothetical protein